MRQLNEKEKDYCRLLAEIEINDSAWSYILLNELPEHCIAVERNNRSVVLFREGIQTDTIYISIDKRTGGHRADNPFAKKAMEAIATLLSLIKLLEKEALIYTVPTERTLSNRVHISGLKDTSTFHGVVLFNGIIADELIDYSQRSIIITQEFKVFIEHDFTTRDDRFKMEQNQTSNRALYISTIATIFAGIAIVVDCSNNPSKDEFKALKASVDSLKAQNSKLVTPNLFLRSK